MTDRENFTLHPPPPTELSTVDVLLAGAAEVDVTPPPGMPKAGYSRNTGDGKGFRTRLRARVVHLRSGRSSLAVVALDLLGGSAVLQRRVAQEIAEHTDVPLAGLFLGATHTHAAPGQFVGSAFYNRFASNRPGFDPAWTEFLVQRVAGAVVSAYETRRPARLAFGSTPVHGFTRNRSLAARLRNNPGRSRDRSTERAFAEIDPDLHLLRVDGQATGGGFEPLAALVVFGIHGTAVSQSAREYNADVWAYVTGELADQVQAGNGTRPVVGAIQGNHGDLAPAVRPGLAGYPEARRLGRGIGAAAAALYERLEGRLSGAVELGAGLRELDPTAGDPRAGGIVLPPPALGCAQLAGATENLTPGLHRIPPFRPGWPQPFPARRPHGGKWRVGGRLHDRLLQGLPRVLPIQVLQLGGLVLAGVPFEVTAEAGRRIRTSVEAELRGLDVQRCVLSSVANEYAGYCTTAEEYSLQYYEGGHTLHGPGTQRWVAWVLAKLARDVLAGGTALDVLPERRFELPVHRYFARASGVRVDRAFEAAAVVAPTRLEEGYRELRWHDLPPGDLDWSAPLVRIEQQAPDGGWQPVLRDGRPVDDSGWNVGVFALGEQQGRHRYAARWYGPDSSRGPRHRLVLPANAGQPERAFEF